MSTARLTYFDLESTGVDAYNDRIVEIALLSEDDALVQLVRPPVPIPAEASAVHGITDADVADAPTFAGIAGKVQALINDAVLVAYNGRRFDTIMLDAELRRAGEPGCIDHREIDLYQLWQRHERRTLAGAVQRFSSLELDEAHSAGADAGALPALLQAMTRTFGLDWSDVDALCRDSIPDGAVDRDGKFTKREDGVVCYAFGKHKGEPVTSHEDYAAWMLRGEFSPETKDIARRLLRGQEVGA